MNDLIRPALYQAWMDVTAVRPRDSEPRAYDIVGPICETGDFLAKGRELALAEGDLLAVHSSGAYGFVMSSNYNTRGRAAEVLVDGSQALKCVVAKPWPSCSLAKACCRSNPHAAAFYQDARAG